MPTFKTSRKGTAPTYAFGKKGKSVVKVICIPVCFKNFANIRRDREIQVHIGKKIGRNLRSWGFGVFGNSVYSEPRAFGAVDLGNAVDSGIR